MSRSSLRDLFDDLARIRGEFLVSDDGYRRQVRSYGETARAARAFAQRLAASGVVKGDRILIWAGNSPEWIVALWGALISGVIVVPIDYRSSTAFVTSISDIVDPKVWLIGDRVDDGLTDLCARGPDRTPLVWEAGTIDWSSDGPAPDVGIDLDDTAEIIFTSGATAEPRGVVLTHRNILANIEPIEREIAKYRAYGRPFLPLRLLNVLPLSHMFGQTMATFIPPLLPGVTLFVTGYSPEEIVRVIRSERATVLVCVPRVLDVLRAHVQHAAPSASDQSSEGRHWTRRWWRHRDVHRMFGLKFWCVVVGAAPLDAGLESFWSRLGFLVIQGYGLTETAPVVTLNHPLNSRRGSVGAPIEGIEIRLAPDGEILVRGDNVTRGYYNAPEATADAFEDGWLKTGDVGTLDEAGRLFVLGRKKEMIVTPDGLNVFPEDVERVLDALPGIRESAVVGISDESREWVSAVIVADDDVDPGATLRAANAMLAPHQRLRDVVRWRDAALPRTEGTRKLKRLAIKAWMDGTPGALPAVGSADEIGSVLGRYTRGQPVPEDASLDDLGLSSLDRVELMVSLEERCNVSLDEATFAEARTPSQVRALVERSAAAGGLQPVASTVSSFPSWNQSWPVRVARRCVLAGLIFPFVRLSARATVTGVEHLAGTEGPVIFAANHQSHMDTPAIMTALPRRWRYRVAPAMAKEYFAAFFHPESHTPGERRRAAVLYHLAAGCFNAFPLPQREAGSREAVRYIGRLADRGISILIFPEGIRTDEGELRPFKAGVGILASRLRLPVVPVRLEGLDRVLHKTWSRPRRGSIRISFGHPESFNTESFDEIAAIIERRVREL